MTEPPSLEHAAQQWARWCWNLGLATFERASLPGRSAEVAEEDVSRAVADPMTQLVIAARASPDGAAKVIADGLRIQAGLLVKAAAYIEGELGEEPELPSGGGGTA